MEQERTLSRAARRVVGVIGIVQRLDGNAPSCFLPFRSCKMHESDVATGLHGGPNRWRHQLL